jgi:hypothetical protein
MFSVLIYALFLSSFAIYILFPLLNTFLSVGTEIACLCGGCMLTVECTANNTKNMIVLYTLTIV